MSTGSSLFQQSAGWFGIHLILRNNAEAEALTSEVPALAALGINALIAEVNYDFAFQSHPELRGANPITVDRIKSLLEACRRDGIRLIPQFQCVGHQSWAEVTFPLLRQYPEFDETPGQYPDNKDIYCRSWCTQHPDVNGIIFALFDELIDAFEADALHVGMDEIFLIASEHCPRCKGHDPARLFAKAALDYHAHLVEKRGVEMMLWGDRLLDSESTGYGIWEAADNGTHPAIDLLPKDIVICDWHYELMEEYPSIPLFLEKGFRVWPAGWKEVPAVSSLMRYAARHDTPSMLGYLATTWGAAKPGALADFPAIQEAARLWDRGGK